MGTLPKGLNMLEKIVEWGKKEDVVRTLILLGSRACQQPVDRFSDYDISVFCAADVSYKDGRAARMLPPQFEIKAIKPSKQEFHEVVNEFWFEIYHIGVYLKRGDLWSVKFRSWAAHGFLLKMIEWHAEAKNDWHYSYPPIGKRIRSWINEELWSELHGVFAHFDAEDSWKALFNTMKLFRRITTETARLLQFSSMEDLSEKMMRFITTLESSEL